MRKLLLTLFLAATCLSSLWAQENAATIEVSTAQELKQAILSNYKAKIRLVADIDISDLGKICDTFAGSIEGGYPIIDSETGEEKIAPHVLKGKRGQGLGADHYLFETLDHATFENVAFERMRVQDDDNNNLGVVARKALGSVFLNFTMAGCSVFCNHDNAGTIVGMAEDCTFDNVKILDSDVTVDGITVGGMVGSSKRCSYTACTTNAHTRVFADGRDGFFFSENKANSGGLAGFSENDQFLLCINIGWVGGNQERVGGFVGWSMGSNFTKCYNYGYVLQCSEESFAKLYSTNAKKIDKITNLDGMMWITWTTSSLTGLGVTAAVILSAGATGPVILVAALLGLLAGSFVIGIDVYLLSSHDELGGIVGHAEHGAFEECSNYGYYSSIDSECGGIVGLGKYLSINNCLCTRAPGSGSEESRGSIIGSAEECTITNCLATNNWRTIGKESKTKHASGNNYVVSDYPKLETSKYEMKASSEQMKSGIITRWLNNGYENKSKQLEPWHQTLTAKGDEKADDFPVLISDHDNVRIEDIKDITVISNSQELRSFAVRVNNGEQFACAVLVNDISLYNLHWTPIGSQSHPFCGIFDGCGHTISGLAIDMTENEGAGLFGVVGANAEIRNVAISNDSKIRSDKDLGTAGVVGMVNIGSRSGNVIITNCGNYADISAPKHAGGILGRVVTGGSDDNIRVMIDSCFNMGTITATQSMSAQLCGYTKEYGYITNCWAGGRLERPDASYPYPYNSDNPLNEMEFFVGYNNHISISNCYAIEPNDLGPRAQQNGVKRITWEEFEQLGFNYIKPEFKEESGIEELQSPTLTSDGWYDLNGNRVDENYNGVRIGGGKKVMVKDR